MALGSSTTNLRLLVCGVTRVLHYCISFMDWIHLHRCVWSPKGTNLKYLTLMKPSGYSGQLEPLTIQKKKTLKEPPFQRVYFIGI